MQTLTSIMLQNLKDEELLCVTNEMLSEAIEEAKLRMLTKRNNAFLSTLLYNFKIIPSQDVETIQHSLEESIITINPDWFVRLPPTYAATALAEQIYHIGFMHEWRKGKKDHQLYQKACDQVVRNMLVTTGFNLLPEAPCNTNYNNMSVESVYKEMEKDWNRGNNKHKNSKGNTRNDPLGNDVKDNSDNPDKAEGSPKAKQNLIDALTSAAMAEEMTSGKNPADYGGEFEDIFKKIKDGKLKWNIILQNYLNELTQGEISYERFDRRMIPFDLYLPTNISKGNINKIAVAFDVSGSVSKEQLTAFLKEMHSIKSQLNPKVMDVVTFNHSIVDIFTFTEYENIDNVKMRISGGTNLKPVFNYYLEPKNRPEFLIVFSDLECYPIQDKTPFETIWICIDNKDAKVNFGKLIHISTEDLTNG